MPQYVRCYITADSWYNVLATSGRMSARDELGAAVVCTNVGGTALAVDPIRVDDEAGDTLGVPWIPVPNGMAISASLIVREVAGSSRGPD